MVEQGDFITGVRKGISSTKKQLSETKQKARPATRRELMEGGLQTLGARKQRKGVRTKVSKAEGQLSKQEQTFEREVARKEPYRAKPKYLNEAYEEAKKELQSRIDRLQKSISQNNSRLKEIKKDGVESEERDKIENIEDNLNEVRAELNAYKSGATGPKAKVVQDWFSGQTRAKANQAVDEIEASQRRREAKREFKSKYGISVSKFKKKDPLSQRLIAGRAEGKTQSEVKKEILSETKEGIIKKHFGRVDLSRLSAEAKKDITERALEKETGIKGGLIEFGAGGSLLVRSKEDKLKQQFGPSPDVSFRTTPTSSIASLPGEVNNVRQLGAPVITKAEADRGSEGTVVKGKIGQQKIIPFKAAPTGLIKNIKKTKARKDKFISTFDKPLGGIVYGFGPKQIDAAITKIPGVNRGLFKGLGDTARDISEGTRFKASKEKPVTEVDITPTQLSKGTRITRAPTLEEMAPQQRAKTELQRVVLQIEQGTLKEDEAAKKIKELQKKYEFSGAKRQAGPLFVESAAKGALATAFPVVGVPVAVADLLQLNPVQAVRAFKRNKKATGLLLGAGFAGGITGGAVAGGTRAALKTTGLDDIKVKYSGNVRTKRVLNVLEDVEGQQISQGTKKVTGTGAYDIDIPIAKGKNIKLKLIEFTKNGKRQYFGEALDDGKIISGVKGEAIVGTGDAGASKVISRFIETRAGKKGLKNVRISEILEDIKVGGQGKVGKFKTQQTQSEARLAKQLDLDNLKPTEFRSIIRKAIFGEEAARARAGQPFTKAEFNKAKQLSKSEFASFLEQTNIRLSKTEGAFESGTRALKTILDIRGKEFGAGKIKPLIQTDNLGRTFRARGLKFKGQKVQSAIRGRSFGVGDSPIKFVKAPKRTPLSKTFGKTSQQLIQKQKPIPKPTSKTSALSLLKNKVKPTATLKGLAKGIQRGAQTSFIKSAVKTGARVGSLIGVGTGIKTAARTSAKETQAMKRKAKQEELLQTKTSQVDLIKTAQKPQIKEVVKEAQLEKTRQTELQKTKLDTDTRLGSGSTPRPVLPKPRIVIKPPIPAPGQSAPLLSARNIVLPGITKANSYVPYVKEGGKFIKVSRKPMELQDALARGSLAVDQSTANTFQLKASKQKKNLEKPKQSNYFLATRNKYRDYRIEKGKRIQLKNKFIEKKGISRIDTVGEKRQLSAARLAKQKGWLKKSKKGKK